MRTTDVFAAQLEREALASQRALERAPAGRPDWRPHPKTMALGYLATLVATMPSWLAMTVEQDALDLAPPGGGGPQAQTWETTADLLAMHAEAVESARAALAGTDDEHLQTRWRLLVGGNVVLEQPRYVVIGDTFCHLAHHRGQLTVYLRLNDVAVPAIYGPSADDRSFG